MVSKVIISPAVLFNITNDIERRRYNDDKIFGYIFGKTDNNSICLNNSHMAPSDNTQHEARINSTVFKNHFNQYQRVYPTQTVVAWYTTSKQNAIEFIKNNQSVKEFQSLIVIVVEMTKDSLEITAFSLKLCGIPGTIFQILLMPIQYRISQNPVHLSTISHLYNAVAASNKKNGIEEIPSINVNLHKNSTDAASGVIAQTREKLVNLLSLLDEKKDTPEVRLVLSRLKNVLTSIEYNATFDDQEQKQDLLMMLYLAGLTKTTLLVGNRTNEIL